MPDTNRFYYSGELKEKSTIALDETAAKHIWQVLRMEYDDTIIIVDGKGKEAIGHIKAAGRYSCDVLLEKVTIAPKAANRLHLCVAFTKNNSRNEWLLEKAAELGVASITPIETVRSEKVHFRSDRWEKILISAILQSQQAYIPEFTEVVPLPDLLKKYIDVPERYIAHCLAEKERKAFSDMLKPNAEAVILIGPEGDFRTDEVSLSISYGYKPVSLGKQRLRTETAAIAACAYFNMVNDAQE